MQRGGWAGWVVFILIILGPRLLPPVAGAITQATGLPVTAGGLVGGLIGIYALVAVARAIGRGLRQANSSSEMQLPNQQPDQAPRMPGPGPQPRPPITSTTGQLPTMTTPPSKAPNFEPVIDPRILAFGIAGLITLGGLFALVLFLVGVP